MKFSTEIAINFAKDKDYSCFILFSFLDLGNQCSATLFYFCNTRRGRFLFRRAPSSRMRTFLLTWLAIFINATWIKHFPSTKRNKKMLIKLFDPYKVWTVSINTPGWIGYNLWCVRYSYSNFSIKSKVQTEQKKHSTFEETGQPNVVWHTRLRNLCAWILCFLVVCLSDKIQITRTKKIQMVNLMLLIINCRTYMTLHQHFSVNSHYKYLIIIGQFSIRYAKFTTF